MSSTEHCFKLLHVSQGVYSVDAVKRASYRHADKGAFDIRIEEEGVCVHFLPKMEIEKEFLEFFRQKFLADVLDEDLRAIIRHETSEVRNLILAHAFSKSALIM